MAITDDLRKTLTDPTPSTSPPARLISPCSRPARFRL